MVSFALHGIGVSAGIAIGRAQLVSHATLEVAHYAITAQQVQAEIERFSAAVAEVRRELENLRASFLAGRVACAVSPTTDRTARAPQTWLPRPARS